MHTFASKQPKVGAGRARKRISMIPAASHKLFTVCSLGHACLPVCSIPLAMGGANGKLDPTSYVGTARTGGDRAVRGPRGSRSNTGSTNQSCLCQQSWAPRTVSNLERHAASCRESLEERCQVDSHAQVFIYARAHFIRLSTPHSFIFALLSAWVIRNLRKQSS